MIAPVRVLAKRAPWTLSCLVLPILILLATTGLALACVGPAEPTTLTTSLSGESKSGAEITVLEGTKVKDQATLEGKNAGKATGKISYAVYKDSSCKELATKAGEFEFKEGKVPASEEKTLEAGKIYYWQAHYGGDSLDAESTSACGKEVLWVKAATSVSTSLSGESKSGEAITVLEGSKVKDKATLSGTNSTTATGKVEFKVYKDSSCKEPVEEAGKVGVSSGSAESEEKKLTAGAVYYWQASYEGDSLHQPSTGACGKEVLTVKAATTLSTLLGGEDPQAGEGIEGEEITVPEGSPVADSATLGGTGSSAATGEVSFKVYADGECKELVEEAGEAELEEGVAAPSSEVELETGTYYWQASYEGDALHQASTSPCTEVVHVLAATSVATTLSGEGEEGDEIEVSEEATVSDSATLSGPNAAEATGKVKYSVYGDPHCEELVEKAGEVTVSGKSVSASTAVALEPGLYYWQAVYTGDAGNYTATSPCGSEIEMVLPPITTTLSGSGESDGSIRVLTGTTVHDEATLHGPHAGEATGSVEYFVYRDEECEEFFAAVGKAKVEGAEVPASSTIEFEETGTYFWQADYSGDGKNPAAISACGSEATIVTAPTSLTTALSGGGKEGAEISVEEGAAVSDVATLSGPEAGAATGSISYAVFADSGCTELVEPAGVADVEGGTAEASSEMTLPPGTYYWQAEYWGDDLNAAATEECGAEVEQVTAPITTTLSGEGQSGADIEVDEGAAVTDQATLHSEHAGEASGTIEYLVYEDEECEKLFANAGKIEFAKGEVPASNPVELEEAGLYWWRVKYSGDGKNPAAESACGSEVAQAANKGEWKYAAFGNSYSSGEGVRTNGGTFYPKTNTLSPGFLNGSQCHRSEQAWPALVAKSVFGVGAIQPPTIYEHSPPRFIFRACSGAVTTNIWPGPGQYVEYEEPGAKWGKDKLAQLEWLKLPNNMNDRKIAKVSVGIGGNDSGFSSIGKACWAFSRRWFPLKRYDPTSCQNAVKTWEEKGFETIEKNLPLILRKVADRVPQAKIFVPLYPRVLNLGKPEIEVGKGLVIDNRQTGFGTRTAAQSIEHFIFELDEVIRKTVKKTGIKAAATIGDTQLALTRFGNHRLGDPQPWLNGFTVNVWESFHPETCGHKAIAALARPFIAPGGAAIGTC